MNTALIKNESIINVDGEQITLENFLDLDDYFVEDGANKFAKKIYEGSYRNKYLKSISEIEYDGKKPHKLSVGERGTLYVSLKLATDPFSSPFIFDQPEDDLDNKFIMNRLVPIFKDIKKYRQVIIITHNANLVVNADAEQIIVAENENEELDYISGAIECSFFDGTREGLNRQGIREHICEILEGGQEAFEKREKKYGFN